MDELSNEQLVREHECWHHEYSRWLRDISRWQSDHQSAIVALDRLQSKLIAHGEELRKHASAIFGHERHLADHERESSICRGSSYRLQQLLKSHREFATRHEHRATVHRRINQDHARTMNGIRGVIRVINTSAIAGMDQ